MQSERIECPVAALDDYREGLYEWISDASKGACGCRMRYDIELYSNEELLELGESWQKQLEEQMADEKAYEIKAAVSFEVLVQETISSGAGDRETAIRWLTEAEGDSYYDEGAFLYHYGLSYEYDIHNGRQKVWNEDARTFV